MGRIATFRLIAFACIIIRISGCHSIGPVLP